MTEKVTVVRIRYDGRDLDLDSVLEASLTLLGFELTDRGFDMEAEERDLVFRRPTAEEKQPICPYCGEVMVKGRIKMEDGTWCGCWLCGCVDEDEETVGEGSKE
jgi:hypothetical protein